MSLNAGPYPKDIKRCRACGADMVFLKTKRGKWIPVNVVPTESGFRGPNAGERKFIYSEHQPHFVTCTDPAPFRTNE